jgi:hypothetical protein
MHAHGVDSQNINSVPLLVTDPLVSLYYIFVHTSVRTDQKK